jgi:HlyD family secretion protein
MPENYTLNGHLPTQILPDQDRDDELITQQDTSQSNSYQSSQSHDWSHATKELLDTLPQVWTRGLLYFLLVFVAIILPWAMFSEVDETGTARGRLEPQGKTVKLDAPVAGTVAEINVKAGEEIQAGQPLLVLESELVRAELQQLKMKQEGQLNRLNQLELLRNQLLLAVGTQQQQNQAQELEKLAQVNQAKRNLEALESVYNLQKEEKLAQVNQAQQNLEALEQVYHLQKEEKLAQVNQAQQSVDSSKANYNLAQIRLSGATEKASRYQQAFENGVISQDRFQDVAQLAEENAEQLVQVQSEIAQAESRVKEQQESYQRTIQQAQAEIDQAQLRLQEQQNSYQRTIQQAQAEIEQAQLRFEEQQRSYNSLVHSGELALLKTQEQLKTLETQITTLKAEIAQNKSQIESLEFQLNQRILAAPINGTVFQFPIQGKGSVVQPGELIAEIAPQGTSLILRAQMATSQTGFLQQGMAVKLKFDAYPFQDYGVVAGKVTDISPTSKITETDSGNGATYELEIQLEKTCIPTPKECIALRPGDTATAEVIVRQRRIIDLILDPFKKLQQGGLKL